MGSRGSHAIHRRDGEFNGYTMRRNMFGLKEERLAASVKIRADNSQAPQRDSGKIVGHEVEKLRIGTCNTGMHAALGLHTRPKSGGGPLELFIRDKALDQNLAKRVAVEPIEFVVQILIVRALHRPLIRNQRSRFDIEKSGGHQEKITRHIKIECLQALHLGEVLLGHLRNGDGPDVDLLTAHELQKQVEGARVPLR